MKGATNVNEAPKRILVTAALPYANGKIHLGHLAGAAGFMAMHGYCAHSRTAAASVTGLLTRFRGDVFLLRDPND